MVDKENRTSFIQSIKADRDLSISAYSVANHLSSLYFKQPINGPVSASYSRIGRLSGLSRKSVIGAFEELIEAGHVAKIDTKAGLPNLYRPVITAPDYHHGGK